MKDKINEIIKHLNEDAESKWIDSTHYLNISNFKEIEDSFQFNIGVGKYDNTTYFTIKFNKDSWEILEQSRKNEKSEKILENFMHYDVMPLFKV